MPPTVSMTRDAEPMTSINMSRTRFRMSTIEFIAQLPRLRRPGRSGCAIRRGTAARRRGSAASRRQRGLASCGSRWEPTRCRSRCTCLTHVDDGGLGSPRTPLRMLNGAPAGRLGQGRGRCRSEGLGTAGRGNAPVGHDGVAAFVVGVLVSAMPAGRALVGREEYGVLGAAADAWPPAATDLGESGIGGGIGVFGAHRVSFRLSVICPVFTSTRPMTVPAAKLAVHQTSVTVKGVMHLPLMSGRGEGGPRRRRGAYSPSF